MTFIRRAFLFLPALFILGAGLVFGFDNVKTHPDLSEAAAQIYNQNSTRQLSNEQIAWITEGSINEDADPRYLNHYYDPTTGLGLNDGMWKGMAAKDWAKTQDSLTGDYSEGAILNNYREGNLKRAYQGIGHIIHLVQDMAVPAHTRNDAHPEGDPFEEWARDYGQVSTQNIQKIKTNNLDQAFDELASYSNSNFFSKDTTKISQNSNYKIVNQKVGDKIRAYLVNRVDGKEYKIAYTQNPDSLYPVYQVDGDYDLNSDYWNLLYPKAIGYSAGVIDYFTQQFSQIDQEEKQEATLGLWDKMKLAFIAWEKDARYNWGDAYMASRLAAGQAWNSLFASNNQDNSPVTTIKEENIHPDNSAAILATKIVADNSETQSNNLPEIVEKNLGVARVIDGDTIVLTNGERVRYIGMDTPELNEPGAQDDECLAWVARLRNIELLGSGKLILVKDPSVDRDKYGRLLRYVYSGNVFINQRLTLEGLAKEYFCQPGWKNCPVTSDQVRAQLIKNAASSAQANKRGLYSGVCDAAKISVALSTETASTSTGVVLGEKIYDTDEATTTNSGAPGNESGSTATTTWVYAPGPGSPTGNGGGSEPLEADTEEQIAINSFNLFDLTSGNIYYTASTTVGVNLEIDDLVDGYYLSASSSTPDVDNSDWQDVLPVTFNLSGADGLKTVYLWLKQGGQIVGHASSAIGLDRQGPILTFNQRPNEFSNATTSAFSISSDEPEIGLRYQIDGGDWNLIATATPFSNDLPFEEGNHFINAEAIDYAGNISSTSYRWLVDLTAPVAYIDNLNYQYTSSDFEVYWSGYDDDDEILDNQGFYDIQYKLNDEEWQDWLTNTASTSAIFSEAVVNGEVITFRARVRDRASNQSEWSDEAETHISIPASPIHRWYINEGTGLTLHDQVAGDDLTIASSTWEEKDFLALGADENIEKNFSSTIMPENLSMTFWFRYPCGNEPFVLNLVNETGDNLLGISLGQAGSGILVNDEYRAFNDASLWRFGDWHSLAITYNQASGEIILYADYREFFSDSAEQIISPATGIKITNGDFNSLIYKLSIWDQTLDEDQVRDNFSQDIGEKEGLVVLM